MSDLSEPNGHQKGCDCVLCREARIRADEREACAKIAEEMYDPTDQPEHDTGHDIALEIRARGGGK